MRESNPLLPIYQSHLTSIGKSENTVRAYMADLQHFAAWYLDSTGKVLHPKWVDSAELVDYRSWLLRTKKKPKTINRRLVALQRFFGWAKQKGHCSENPFELLEGVRVKEQIGVAPRWLDEKEQLALLRAVRKTDNVRDLAIIQTLRRTGLRVSELACLEVADIVIQERSGSVTVHRGKGTKHRMVPLSNDARQAIEAYLAQRPPAADGPFILGQRGPISADGIRDVIAKYAYDARLDEVTPHTLRHTFAKNLVDAGTPLDQVATLLGHESIDTVKIYTTPSRRDLEKAVRRASGEIGEG